MSGGVRERTPLQISYATTEIRRRDRRIERPKVLRTFGWIGLVGGLCGFLLYRLWPDVSGKSLYEDEAIAGLISTRPMPEILDTVLVDRGGAPLHFVLGHVAFWVDTSPEALRWLSVVFALGTVPLCFELGRRLDGAAAGIVAAAVAASSTALAVYGSFGRMYALLAFVAALFAVFFVRALELRTTAAVAAASAAGWLLPATHPYGAIPAFVALVAAAVLWRGRPLRAAWPVAVAVLAALPLLAADLRLADRSDVGAGGERSLASPGEAWTELIAAVSAFAGGDGVALVFFSALALVGLAVLLRRSPAVAALALSTAIPPLLFVLVRTDATPDLSPRHLFYGLPLWAAAIGVGAARLAAPLGRELAAVAVAAIALVAVLAPPSSLRDPRELGFGTTAVGAENGVHTATGDVLVPYSTVFLASLPNVDGALALPHAPGDQIVRTLEHAEEPIGAVHVAIPTEPWTVRRLEGPFDKPSAIAAAAAALAEAEHTPRLRKWFAWIEPGLCEALRELNRPCP
jgi:Dolichyl-phosphate-mannose-protein mannosyltransferase